MFFFDCIYYLCANFYKRFKSEADTWKGMGIMLTGGFAGFFISSLVVLLHGVRILNIEFQTWMTVLPPIICLFLSIIRYNKFTNYDKVKDRMEELEKSTLLLLQVLVILYMIFGLVGGICFAIFLSPHK